MHILQLYLQKLFKPENILNKIVNEEISLYLQSLCTFIYSHFIAQINNL